MNSNTGRNGMGHHLCLVEVTTMTLDLGVRTVHRSGLGDFRCLVNFAVGPLTMVAIGVRTAPRQEMPHLEMDVPETVTMDQGGIGHMIAGSRIANNNISNRAI